MITQWALLSNIFFLWFDKFLNRDESQKGTGKGMSLYSGQGLLISTGLFFFFSTGSSLFPFWGITSIKITGLGDQLLLRVLSLLLLASFFCGPNTQACSNKCLNHRWSVPSLSFTRSWRLAFILSSPIVLHIYDISLLIHLVEFRWYMKRWPVVFLCL